MSTAVANVNEGTTCYITVTMLDKTGAQAAPSSATWELIDLESGSVLQAPIAFGPAAQSEITVLGTLNAMQDENKAKETRRIVVKAIYGAGDELVASYDYHIRNMSQQ